MLKLRLVCSSLLLLTLFFSTALAQSEIVRTDNRDALTIAASASGERVRFTAPSSVVQMHLEVYSADGEKVFDIELKRGNVLDWHLQDGQAERIGSGSYICVVTVKNLSGKLTQKIGTVTISNQRVTIEPVEASELSARQAQAIGPMEEESSIVVLKEGEQQTGTVIAHNGEEGQITRGIGALSFRLGDFYSGKDTEQMRLSEDGNIGIGVKDPQARLDVDGFIRATQGIVFPDGSIQFSASKKTFGPQSAGPGKFSKSPSSGQEHFDIAAAGTGTQSFIAKWTETGGAGTLGNSIIFDNGTNVGIGTTSPAKKLDVRGGQIALDNGRFLYSRRTNGQFQEAFGIDSNDDIVFNRNSLVPGVDLDAPKASSALIFGTGAGRFFDVRNSANVPMLRIFEATGNVGIGTPNPLSKLSVQTINFSYGMTHTNGTVTVGSYIDPTGGWLGTRSNHPLFFFTNGGLQQITLATNGNLGIGTVIPTSKVEIAAQDGLAITGFQPFLTLRDTNSGGLRSILAGGNGDFGFYPASFIGGVPAMLIKNNTGNVGIGTVNPTARLQVAAGDIPAISASSQGNAVIGLSTTPGFAAVYGENTSGSSGYGVYGKGTSGYAMWAEGNAGQQRDKGGFVKAMVYVNDDGTILRCYNGLTGVSLTGGTNNTGCGFTVTRFTNGGYGVDFGFQVNDRFVSVSPQYDGRHPFGSNPPNNRGANWQPVVSVTTINVFTFAADEPDDTTDWGFMLIVY